MPNSFAMRLAAVLLLLMVQQPCVAFSTQTAPRMKIQSIAGGDTVLCSEEGNTAIITSGLRASLIELRSGEVLSTYMVDRDISAHIEPIYLSETKKIALLKIEQRLVWWDITEDAHYESSHEIPASGLDENRVVVSRGAASRLVVKGNSVDVSSLRGTGSFYSYGGRFAFSPVSWFPAATSAKPAFADTDLQAGVSFSANNKYALVVSKSDDLDNKLLVIDSTRRKARRLNCLKGKIGHHAFLSGDDTVVVRSGNNHLNVVNVRQDKVIKVIDSPFAEDEAFTVVPLPWGKKIVVIGETGNILELAGANYRPETAVLPDSKNGVNASKFCVDRKKCVLYYMIGNVLYRYDLATRKQVAVNLSLSRPTLQVMESGSDVITTDGSNLVVWDLKTGGMALDASDPVLFSKAKVFLIPALSAALIQNRAGELFLKEKTGTAQKIAEFTRGAILRCDLSLDRKWIALVTSGDAGEEVWVLNLEKKEQRRISYGFGSPRNLLVAFTGDSKWFVVAGKGTVLFQLYSLPDFAVTRLAHEEEEYGLALGILSLKGAPAGDGFITSGHLFSRVWSASKKGSEFYLGPEPFTLSTGYSPDDKQALLGGEGLSLTLWDMARSPDDTPKKRFSGHQNSIRSVAFSGNKKLAYSVDDDGVLIVWDLASETWLAKLVSFSDGGWAVVDPSGRFDTNTLDEIRGLHWIMPDDPLTPVPLEAFMKDYYQPRLLPRILAGESFPQVRDLQLLNRVQPAVAISPAQQEGEGAAVTVTVRVAGAEREYDRAGTRVTVGTGVHDVKLFRDGQLVGLREGVIDRDRITGQGQVVFEGVRLPLNGAGTVEFSAYAFNDDGVKSPTGRMQYVLPAGLAKRKGKAYLIAIGVNRHQNSAWDLRFAVNDALKFRDVLSERIRTTGVYSDTVGIALTDELASKENIKAVFAVLAGDEKALSIIKKIPGASKLAKAVPEDLIIVSFSGHGHVDDAGVFYTFTYDTGPGRERIIDRSLLDRLVSGNELSEWLRYVDAGRMALVIDACHSAAGVGEGFKAGPMGSRGLGQLAYDKGISILAASQADDVALESDRLQQGLLTYALVHDGLEAYQADFRPADKTITLGELLAYGVERVPKLYEEVKTDSLSTFGGDEAARGAVVRIGDGKNSSLRKKNPYQTPALFDFTRTRKGDVVVAGPKM